MQEKSLSQLQKQVDDLVNGEWNGYWPPLSILAQLVEETGELAKELNHQYGGKVPKNSADRKHIEEELGDILFVLVCLANSLKIDLRVSLEKVLEKYNERDKERWKKK